MQVAKDGCISKPIGLTEFSILGQRITTFSNVEIDW